MTRPILMATFSGVVMPLYQAAKLAGLSEYCVRKRWQKGERGADLFRPSMHGRFRKPAGQFDDLRAKRETGDAAERAKQEQRLSRQRREQEARERVAAEHAAAFARPLIDSDLLKPKEHRLIVDRVKFSGQRCWRKDGGATF